MSSWSEWFKQFSEHYPHRWWFPLVNIYGGPKGQASRECYLTRIMLTPRTPWGRLYLHIFYREDMDRDPHDHPFWFYTMPLNQGYTEEVFIHNSAPEIDCFTHIHVPRWHWAFRPAEHTHRIITTDRGSWPLVTLVWRGPTERTWGFWCYLNRRLRSWVSFTEYLGGPDGVANRTGDNDRSCPGGPL